MDLERIDLSERAKRDLVSMSARRRGYAAGAITFLADDRIRAKLSVDLYAFDEEYESDQLGFATDHIFLAYVEMDDRLIILHIAGQSRFRPPMRPFPL